MRFLSLSVSLLLIVCLLFVGCTEKKPDPKAETVQLPTPETGIETRAPAPGPQTADPEEDAQASGTQAVETEACETDSAASDPITLTTAEEEEDGLPTDPPITEEVSGQVVIGG